MNKRKASADKSSTQKASSRRPSVSSLQQKPSKPEKLPSTHDLVDPSDSSKITNKAADVSLPKTRFNSQDRCKELRSCSSPRLKSFPSEKIKKLESPPPFSPKSMVALIGQQDPRQAGISYTAGHLEQCRDAGQGDVAAVQQHQQSQGVESASQQQVVPQQAIHQIGQMNPHSESMLSQQVSNVQSHRPFVPHGLHDYSPQRNFHVTSSNPTQGLMTPQPHMQQVTNVSVVDQRKVKSEDQIGINDLDYEKQPIGGRNAAVYRRTIMSKQQAQPNSQLTPIALCTPNVNQQNVYSQCPSHSHVPLYRNLQNPQQIYQQLQQNIAQQQQMQQKVNNYQMQMMGTQQQVVGHFPNQGMISPQDVMASQMRNTRMLGPNQPNYATNHRDLNYAMNPQNRWMTNGQVAEHSSIKAQLNPYNVDVVNGNQALYRPQNQQQQLLPQYQHQLVHQHQMYRNPVQRQQNLNAHSQPSFNQQMNVNPSQQMVPLQQFNPQEPQDKHPDVQTQRRKPLKFPIGMIRDQDKLLATMKQQGVPMDIMRRQFEMLLNEQRKHLEYLELLRQQEESPAVTKTVVTNRKRKKQDEKPEWMIHLTPPRLSYVEIEKMYEQRKKQEEMEMIQQQQQSQQMASQTSGQQIPVQVTNQQNYQHWQQQRPLQNYNHMYTQVHPIPGFGNMNELMKINANNLQSMQQYIHQQPHQHYNPQIMQQYQQFDQAVPQQNQEQVQSFNQFPKYDDNRSSTEPSSLLKLRRYKKEIRPQKLQNGLQDLEAAKRMLENDTVSSEIRKRLQYLVNLAPKKPVVRLNGIQDYSEAEAEFQHRLITSTLPPVVKRISANGLENSRNPNNPPAQRLLVKKMEQEYVREYPRQKSDISRNYLQAERENGTTNQPQLLVQQPLQQQQQQLPAPGQQQQQQQLQGQNLTSVVPHNCGNVMSFRFDGNYPQHYQQMQQYYQNTRNLVRNNGEGDVCSSQGAEQNKGSFDHAGGDASHGNMTNSNRQITGDKMLSEKVYYGQPDIHESKTIGGVRYLARKQDYLPNQQIMIPETLIANKHEQIPMMN